MIDGTASVILTGVVWFVGVCQVPPSSSSLLMELFVGESGGLIGIKLLVLASLEVSSNTSFDCFSTTDDVDGPIRGC